MDTLQQQSFRSPAAAPEASGPYLEALRYLYALEPRGIKLGLDRVRQGLALLGEPQRDLRCVLVAGTNGKGSVATAIARGVREAGYRVGLFTSPHLHRFGERIRIDGVPLGDDELVRALRVVRRVLGQSGAPTLTFFEVTTLLALTYFRACRCDLVVLEVGLGGRLDATNVVTPELSVITQIALDHEAQLSANLSEIALEKAGILRVHTPAVCSARHPTAREVVGVRARELGADLSLLGQDFLVPDGDDALETELLGSFAAKHQRDNAACALAALRQLQEIGWELPDQALRAAFAGGPVPGRLELLDGAEPVLFDAAHNPAGCVALAAYLRGLLPRPRRTVLVFGAMGGKAVEGMLPAFDDCVQERVYVAAKMRRAVAPEALLSVRAGSVAASVSEGVRRARELAGPGGLVVVAGSVFVVGEARAELLSLPCDPPIAM